MNPDNWSLGNVPLNNDFSIIESLVLAPTTVDALAALHDRIRAKGRSIYTITDLCHQRYPLPTIILEIQQSCVYGIEKYMVDLSVDHFYRQLDEVRNTAARERREAVTRVLRLEMENKFYLDQFKHLVRKVDSPAVAAQEIARLEGYSEVVRQLDPFAERAANRCTIAESEAQPGERPELDRLESPDNSEAVRQLEPNEPSTTWKRTGRPLIYKGSPQERCGAARKRFREKAQTAAGFSMWQTRPKVKKSKKRSRNLVRGTVSFKEYEGDMRMSVSSRPEKTLTGALRSVKELSEPELFSEAYDKQSSGIATRDPSQSIPRSDIVARDDGTRANHVAVIPFSRTVSPTVSDQPSSSRWWPSIPDSRAYGANARTLHRVLDRRLAELGAAASTSRLCAPDDDVDELFQTLGISENQDAIWLRPEKRQDQSKKRQNPGKSKCVIS